MQDSYINNHMSSEDNKGASWDMIKLPQPFSVYCPMVRAGMEIHAESLEDMDQFTQFLIQVVGNGQGPSIVEEVTLLNPNVIQDNFEDMRKMGLLEFNTQGDYILAPLGKRYFQFIKYINDFNDQRVTVQINMHTGTVVEDDYQLLTIGDLPEDYLRLKSVINKQIFWNENPVNARDLFLSKHGFGLNDDDREEIHVKLILEDGILYRPIEIDQLPALSMDRVPGFCCEITKYVPKEVRSRELYPLQRPIIPFKFNIRKTELDYYRPVLSTLAKIEKLDTELLSIKAHNLIRIWYQEQSFASKLYSFYFDLVTGEIGRFSSIEHHESEHLSNKLDPYYWSDSWTSEATKTILTQVLQEEDIDWDQWEITIDTQQLMWIKQWITEDLLFGPENGWFEKEKYKRFSLLEENMNI